MSARVWDSASQWINCCLSKCPASWSAACSKLAAGYVKVGGCHARGSGQFISGFFVALNESQAPCPAGFQNTRSWAKSRAGSGKASSSFCIARPLKAKNSQLIEASRFGALAIASRRAATRPQTGAPRPGDRLPEIAGARRRRTTAAPIAENMAAVPEPLRSRRHP